MTTLRKDMSEVPGDVDIIRVEAETEWGGDFGMEEWAEYGLPYVGPVSGAPEGLLDHEYDDGYGGPERPMWTAWTDTHVGYGTEYDGSTATDCVRRNPPDH